MRDQAARSNALPAWEEAYIFLALLLVTGALEPALTLFGNAGSLTESSPANLYSALAIYTLATALLLTQPAEAWALIRREPLLLLLLALPLFSTFWSDDPTVTFRRAAAHAMTGVFCFYLAARLSPEELLRRLLVVLFAGAVASFIYTALAPGLAIGHGVVNQGAWSGVYGHKALLGRVAAIAFFVALFVEPRSLTESIMRWSTMALFVVLTLFSQSRASWAMIALGLGAAFVFMFWRSPRLSGGLKLAVPSAVALAMIVTVIVTADDILAAVGRSENLSGRTKLWSAAIAVADAKHPDLGAGYRNFWTEDSAAGVRSYIPNWVGLPGHGHNGYLDVWLELGIPGVLLFAAFLLQTMTRLAMRIWRAHSGRVWLALSILFVIFLINNLSASVALKHSDILWVLTLLACIYAHRSEAQIAAPSFAWVRPQYIPQMPAHKLSAPPMRPAPQQSRGRA